jgi:hypothetical protein
LLGHIVERLDDAFGQRATVHGSILGFGQTFLQQLFQFYLIQFNWIEHFASSSGRRFPTRRRMIGKTAAILEKLGEAS